MKQGRLCMHPGRKTPADKAREHHTNNLRAAKTIVAEPGKHGYLLETWARNYLEKHGRNGDEK